ncbi:MAG: NUDIX domain-containing protein [Turicibacter sp.]|nr:NUDIX domain-containing protein [Turicibacter sp.]
MRVANSLLLKDNKILLLFKPSRKKWFLPGGKAEFSENVIQTGCREFFEETGLELQNAELGAVTTIVVEEESNQTEWMLYTIKGTDAIGELNKENREGTLSWHDISEIDKLPMFEGDRFIIKHLINSNEPIVSTQFYTPSYDLIKIISSYNVESKLES